MYDDFSAHASMLRDQVRTGGYKQAIERIVRPGDVVVDFGCGSGILSFFAARAGARKIYAIDKSSIIRLAKKLARSNNADAVEFLHGEHTVEVADPADVLVSEWMGHFLFAEWMHEPLVSLRDRVLKPSGKMLPEQVSLHAGLVVDPGVVEGLDFFRDEPYGIDFSLVADWPAFDVRGEKLSSDQIEQETALLAEIDMKTTKGFPEKLEGRIAPSRSVTVHALAGWFRARLCEDVELGTGPFDPDTHWRQLVFPLTSPVEVEAGQPVLFELCPFRVKDTDSTLWKWSVRCGDQAVEMDNFVHRAWLGMDEKSK